MAPQSDLSDLDWPEPVSHPNRSIGKPSDSGLLCKEVATGHAESVGDLAVRHSGTKPAALNPADNVTRDDAGRVTRCFDDLNVIAATISCDVEGNRRSRRRSCSSVESVPGLVMRTSLQQAC